MPTKIDGRIVDGRFKKGVDRGVMSSNRIPLPIKKNFKPTILSEDPMPKQYIRQAFAQQLNKGRI